MPAGPVHPLRQPSIVSLPHGDVGRKQPRPPLRKALSVPGQHPGKGACSVSWKLLRKRSKRPSLCKARRCCKSSPRRRAKVPPTQTAAPDLLLWCLFFSERKSTELVSRKPGRDLISCGEASARAPPTCAPSLPQQPPLLSPSAPGPTLGQHGPLFGNLSDGQCLSRVPPGLTMPASVPGPPPPVWLDAAQPQEPSPPMGPLPWRFHPLGSLITSLRSQLEFPLLQTLFPVKGPPLCTCRSFLWPAVTNYHQSGGLGQHTCVLSRFWKRPEVQSRLGQESRGRQGCVPSGGSKGKSGLLTSCSF